MRLRILLLVAGAGASVALRGLDDQVPRALVLESGRPVLEFAMLMANASIPSGIEIRHADATHFRRLRFDQVSGSTVPVSTLVDQFNTTHADYRASMKDGVLVIRPVERTTRFLDERSTLQPVQVTGVMNALTRVFGQLVPSLAVPSASLGSFLGGVPPDLGENVTIDLNGAGRPVLDVLIDIVKQAPRTWYVETEPVDEGANPRISRIGFLLANGKGVFQPIEAHSAR